MSRTAIWLAAFLGRKEKQKVWQAKSQCARILEALCEGQEMGGKEAVQLVGHNGLRRLNQVRQRLRAAGIPYATETYARHAGNPFKKTWLSNWVRDDARKLLGKAA
jgi:hypothetical protein